jgi:hypothetical protein
MMAHLVRFDGHSENVLAAAPSGKLTPEQIYDALGSPREVIRGSAGPVLIPRQDAFAIAHWPLNAAATSALGAKIYGPALFCKDSEIAADTDHVRTIR